ncbi:hypothetical protein NGUA15_00963 [Salmonella enterica]|nr:hypothetical protein NGUA15_00963 [Salmonella enterica]
MDNKHLAFALTGNRIDEITQKRITVLIVNTNAGFYRHRNRDDITHGFNTIGDQLRIAHQTGAKHTVLHAIGGAPHVEVNFIVATRFRQLCTMRKLSRIASTKL